MHLFVVLFFLEVFGNDVDACVSIRNYCGVGGVGGVGRVGVVGGVGVVGRVVGVGGVVYIG